MEGIFAKIPDIGEKIFKEMDNHSLVKCKEVQRSWYNFINEEKVLWFRMIQNYVGDNNEFLLAWKKVLKRAPIDFVSHLAIATHKFNAIHQLQFYNSPIHVAASDGSVDLYEQIMEKIAHLSPENIFGEIHPLFHAAENGQFEIYKHIIGKYGENNPARFDGVTPLYMAAENGHYEICKLIISNVYDKNPARDDGATPLYIAAQNGHFEICKLIIAYVDDKNPATHDGVTPIFMAAQTGHYEIFKLIIDNLDDKNPARPNGATPLFLAAQNGLKFVNLSLTMWMTRILQGMMELLHFSWQPLKVTMKSVTSSLLMCLTRILLGKMVSLHFP